jgi:hypothetical protein
MANVTLQQISEHTYLISAPANIGVYVNNNQAILMAKPSRVTDVIPASGPILETGLEAIPLPGHYFEMIGIKSPDDVLFLADSVFSETILLKYHLVFLYDIHAQFETLEHVKTLKATYYIPSHGDLLTEIQPLVESNIKKIQEILAFIGTCCEEPKSIEDILAQVCTHYHIALNANQYVLVISTVKSYLAYLAVQGKLITRFSDGKLFWQHFA